MSEEICSVASSLASCSTSVKQFCHADCTVQCKFCDPPTENRTEQKGIRGMVILATGSELDYKSLPIIFRLMVANIALLCG